MRDTHSSNSALPAVAGVSQGGLDSGHVLLHIVLSVDLE